MSQDTDNPITFRSLYTSPIVTVRDYSCHAGRSGPSAEECSISHDIVLLRHGVFCQHVGRQSVTADVNQVMFFSRGSTYRVSHPGDCGDRGTVFTPSPRVLHEIVRALDPSIEDHPERPFPFTAGPCDDGVFWRHCHLVQHLERADEDPPEPLWADVTALQLVADVLQAAFTRQELPRQRRRSTETDHADRAEAAKTYLASHLGERLTLDEVAQAVHSSPFHLARIFRQRTGLSLHRYLMRLRLRASWERLAAGVADLTALALELGFSSHSHFTDTFRREFGRPPSEVRKALGRQGLTEMSTNLEV